MAGLAKNEKYDKKTGKKEKKDRARMKIAKMAAAKRKGKMLSEGIKKKISKALKKVWKTHKTKDGRKAKMKTNGHMSAMMAEKKGKVTMSARMMSSKKEEK